MLAEGVFFKEVAGISVRRAQEYDVNSRIYFPGEAHVGDAKKVVVYAVEGFPRAGGGIYKVHFYFRVPHDYPQKFAGRISGASYDAYFKFSFGFHP